MSFGMSCIVRECQGETPYLNAPPERLVSPPSSYSFPFPLCIGKISLGGLKICSWKQMDKISRITQHGISITKALPTPPSRRNSKVLTRRNYPPGKGSSVISWSGAVFRPRFFPLCQKWELYHRFTTGYPPKKWTDGRFNKTPAPHGFLCMWIRPEKLGWKILPFVPRF
ncbi:hypothetical protein TNIN_369581 [Trichonephila inaurata madagascariensis]|uniref:Uncharacterized protein n=1 Tax=Trichonephila inaurata madagascariensis TaxID=2747483 RepID=A0A8X6X0E2_9ARAC|nr:hypothetical protein TNIN_369581 [Trichonephila inaurata madagascariensis]